jgi:hypothetical protein
MRTILGYKGIQAPPVVVADEARLLHQSEELIRLAGDSVISTSSRSRDINLSSQAIVAMFRMI